MENRFKSNKFYRKYSKFLILGLFVIFFLSVSGFIIYKGLDIIKQREVKYIDNSSVDYSVYLKDNNYFNVPYLGKGEKYLSTLIDKIYLNFSYNLNSEEKMSGNYEYNIVASLVVKEQNKDDILWKKDFDLTNAETIDFNNTNTIGVTGEININYDYYNEMATSFKKDYGVLTDSYLYVYLKVNTAIDYGTDNYNIEKSPYVIIPLGEKTIEIDEFNIENDVSSKIISYTKYPILNYILLVLGIIFVVIYLYLGFTVIKRFIKSIKNRNKYEEFIRKIFSNYDQIIVTSSKLPSLNEIDVLDVNSFEDLVDAQMEVHKPIVFNEVIRNKKTVFVLVDNGHAYRYIVRAEDFK